MKWRRPTILRAMLAVAAIAAVLALASNEAWRWGYPRRVPFEHSTALRWLSRVTRSDFRMYDGEDVAALLAYVADRGLLVGMTSEQVLDRIGPTPEGGALRPDIGTDGPFLTFVVGMVPEGTHAGPATLVCYFDDRGVCRKVVPVGSY